MVIIPEVVFEDNGGLGVLEFDPAVFEQIEHTGQLHVELTTT